MIRKICMKTVAASFFCLLLSAPSFAAANQTPASSDQLNVVSESGSVRSDAERYRGGYYHGGYRGGYHHGGYHGGYHHGGYRGGYHHGGYRGGYHH